jgi:hypothetical protein
MKAGQKGAVLLEKQAKMKKSNLKLLFKKLFDQAIGDMYENDFNFYKKIEENPNVKDLIKDNLFEDVFRRGKEINP